MRTSATVVRLKTGQPVKLDDGPKTIELCQREIMRSSWGYQRIADEAGVCVATVGRLATGETKSPKMRSVVLILAALGWDIFAHEQI